MDFSPANKNMFTVSFILHFQNKRGSTKGVRLKEIFFSKQINNLPAS